MKAIPILLVVVLQLFFFNRPIAAAEGDSCFPGTWQQGADGAILICPGKEDGTPKKFERYQGISKILSEGEIVTFAISAPYPKDEAPSEINILVSCGKQAGDYPKEFGFWGIRLTVDASKYLFVEEAGAMILCADTPP